MLALTDVFLICSKQETNRKLHYKIQNIQISVWQILHMCATITTDWLWPTHKEYESHQCSKENNEIHIDISMWETQVLCSNTLKQLICLVTFLWIFCALCYDKFVMLNISTYQLVDQKRFQKCTDYLHPGKCSWARWLGRLGWRDKSNSSRIVLQLFCKRDSK